MSRSSRQSGESAKMPPRFCSGSGADWTGAGRATCSIMRRLWNVVFYYRFVRWRTCYDGMNSLPLLYGSPSIAKACKPGLAHCCCCRAASPASRLHSLLVAQEQLVASQIQGPAVPSCKVQDVLPLLDPSFLANHKAIPYLDSLSSVWSVDVKSKFLADPGHRRNSNGIQGRLQVLQMIIRSSYAVYLTCLPRAQQLPCSGRAGNTRSPARDNWNEHQASADAR